MPYNVQTARLANAVRRFFGVKGQLPLQLVDDVFPFMDIGRPPFDLAFQADIDYWYARVLAPSVAGEFSMVQVNNPPASGKLVVIETILSTLGGIGVAIILGQGSGSLVAGVSPPLSRDGRHVNQAFTVEVRSSSTSIAPAFHLSGAAEHDLPFVLAPNNALFITYTGLATPIGIELAGYERPATEEELAP